MNHHLTMPYPRPSPIRRTLTLFAAIILCSACVAPDVKDATTRPAKATKTPKAADTPAPSDKAQQELASGIASYEDGAYKLATRQLQTALALGLDTRARRASAHKYLAFIYCVGDRERQCRDEFRKALDADPGFDLSPAESGHPTWGPVFRELKNAGKPAGN